MKAIFANIINCAIFDWNAHKEKREEIRAFFKSDWGEELCDIFGKPAREVLAGLENGTIKIDEKQWRNFV